MYIQLNVKMALILFNQHTLFFCNYNYDSPYFIICIVNSLLLIPYSLFDITYLILNTP